MTKTTARDRLAGEVLIGAADAAARCAGPVVARTVVRWIQRGVRHRGGGRVYLDGFLLGSKWVTSAEAVDRFLAAVNAAMPPSRTRSPAQARAAHRRAEKEAEAMGL